MVDLSVPHYLWTFVFLVQYCTGFVEKDSPHSCFDPPDEFVSRSPVLTGLGGTNDLMRKPPELIDGTFLPEGLGRPNDPPGAGPPVFVKAQAQGKRNLEPHPLDSFPKNKSRKELGEAETPSEEQLKEAASMLAKMGDEMDQRMKEKLKVCSFRIHVYFLRSKIHGKKQV